MSDQGVICDGCNVRPPFEHRCAGDGCEAVAVGVVVVVLVRRRRAAR